MRRALRVAAVLAFTALPASAHLVQTGFGTFYDGIVHLAMTPVDVMVVVGLGLLAGSCGKPASRGLLLALPAAWLAGAVAGAAYPGAGELPWATTTGVIVVGALVAASAPLPRGAVLVLSSVLGALHGFVSGSTMTPAGADGLAIAGTVLAVFGLASLVPAAVVSLRAAWTRVAVRVAGSWIAAIGLLMLGWLARPDR